MTVQIERPASVEHWLESASGFPPGGIGTSTPDGSGTVIASARGLNLLRRQVDEVLAFTEFMAGHALTTMERADLTDDLVDAFEDSPKHALRFLTGVTGGVRRVAPMHPVERAQRRLQALTTSYVTELRRQADGAEFSPIMAMVSRYNPVLRHWAATGVVLVADALESRIEQHRLVLGMVGRQVEDAAALGERLLDRTVDCGRLEVAELAASQLRLMSTRAWLRDIGDAALARLREELEPAVASALDVDIVVQQVAYRAAMAQAS